MQRYLQKEEKFSAGSEFFFLKLMVLPWSLDQMATSSDAAFHDMRNYGADMGSFNGLLHQLKLTERRMKSFRKGNGTIMVRERGVLRDD